MSTPTTLLDFVIQAAIRVGLALLVWFKVGDFVVSGGVTGTVKDLGMFHTAIDTEDNVRTLVGNNTIFTGTISNFSTNPYRRVLLPAQLANGADHAKAIALLTELGKKIPNVIPDPPPSASISGFKPAGPVVTLEVYSNINNYWQVFYDGNRVIRDALVEPDFPLPTEPMQMLGSS